MMGTLKVEEKFANTNTQKVSLADKYVNCKPNNSSAKQNFPNSFKWKNDQLVEMMGVLPEML